MGLMHLAAAVAPGLDLTPCVGFVDHGLRSGVDEEWELVAAAARGMGLEARREHVRETPRAGSVQAWAREARYALLERMARDAGASFVATGHTLDDQAETVLLRLLRGTGLDGLGGIPERRGLADGVTLVRPLLGLRREGIREYLRSLGGTGRSWVEDPSNRDPRFRRSRVRSELLPLMESLQPEVAVRLAGLARESLGLTEATDLCLMSVCQLNTVRLGQGVKVDCEVMASLPEGLRGRLVRLAIRSVRGDLRRVERVHLAIMESASGTGRSTGLLPLPGPSFALVDRGSLYVFPGPLPPRPGHEARLDPGADGKWRARCDEMGAAVEVRPGADGLVLRTRKRGDRLWGSKRKLKDLLVERGVPRPYRDFVPLLASGGDVIAMPGLLPCRRPDLDVLWTLDSAAPVRDLGISF
jgi:tRNA(Ile)-lysidine synthase